MEEVLPTLDVSAVFDVVRRRGAIEAVLVFLESLGMFAVPFLVHLAMPVLASMSDADQAVRTAAARAFARIVYLMPLDNGDDASSSAAETNSVDASTTPAILTPSNTASVTNHASTDETKHDRLLNSLVASLIVKDDSLVFSCDAKSLLSGKRAEDRKFLDQLLRPKEIPDAKLGFTVLNNVQLRHYQQEGLNWLFFLHRYKLHGILCDDMGLGKTLMATVLLAQSQLEIQRNRSRNGHANERYANERYANEGRNGEIPPSLVVCPPTLVGHWMDEIRKFVPCSLLRPLVCVGFPVERKEAQSIFSSSKSSFNVFVTSYDVVRSDAEFFSSRQWHYVVLDEGHVIKNFHSKVSRSVKKISANHRLILTGTPIQNSAIELWALFDFLMPGFLGVEKQFHTKYGKKIMAIRDPKASAKEREQGVLAMEALHRQVLPFILRRLKSQVLKDLPPKIIQDFYCDLSPLQKLLYEDFSATTEGKKLHQTIESEGDAEKGGSQKHYALQALQYLRKVCNHPALVLSPSHPKYADFEGAESNSLMDFSHSSKLMALRQLLWDCGIGLVDQIEGGDTAANAQATASCHRVLIFCQFKSMLDFMEEQLFKKVLPSVSYLRLDGNVPVNQRFGIVTQFNGDSSIDLLLLTTSIGGLGLNLTGADTVIFLDHDWNPAKDLQAMDRAHRLGQKRVVNVYRLITRDTIEEKIMSYQRFKTKLANTIVSSENASLDSMSSATGAGMLDLFDGKEGHGDGGSGDGGNGDGGSGDGNDKPKLQQKKRGLEGLLNGLEDLWDKGDYEKEYDVEEFVRSLQK